MLYSVPQPVFIILHLFKLNTVIITWEGFFQVAHWEGDEMSRQDSDCSLADWKRNPRNH